MGMGSLVSNSDYASIYSNIDRSSKGAVLLIASGIHRWLICYPVFSARIERVHNRFVLNGSIAPNKIGSAITIALVVFFGAIGSFGPAILLIKSGCDKFVAILCGAMIALLLVGIFILWPLGILYVSQVKQLEELIRARASEGDSDLLANFKGQENY